MLLVSQARYHKTKLTMTAQSYNSQIKVQQLSDNK